MSDAKTNTAPLAAATTEGAADVAAPAPDPELEALQREVAEIMAEPEQCADPVEGVQQALNDLDVAASDLAMQLVESPPAPTEEAAPSLSPPPAASAEDDAALNTILADDAVAEDVESASDPTAPSVEAGAVSPASAAVVDPDAELQSLMSAVQQSLEAEAAQPVAIESDAPAASEAPPAENDPAPPAPVPSSIEDIDAQVASQAERAIAREEALAPVPALAPSPEPAPAQPEPAHVAAHAPVPAPTPAPVASPKPEPAPARPPAPVVEKKPKPPGFFKTKVEAPLLRTIGLASKPLASRPGMVNAAGLVALNTVVLAAGLWVYTLYFRPAHATPEGHGTFDFAHSGLPQPDHEPGAHDEHASDAGHGAPAGDGHGAKKDDGHGTKKDDGHGAKKDDGHGGGGHGSAAPAEPKKSIIASSGQEYILNPKKDAGKDAKAKDAKKSGGH